MPKTGAGQTERTVGLAELAQDPRLLDGRAAPTFPAGLILRERTLLAAALTGDEARVAQLRAELIEAITALRAQDEARLADLGAGSRSSAERDFLQTRLNVLDARVEALDAAGDAVETRSNGVPIEALGEPAEPVGARHRDDIQGLRAVAVLLVALAHAGIGVLAGGFVGVDVFFVLSGFLITGLLVAEARRRRWVSLIEFYLRRARRILPAAALTLLVTDFAAYHLLNFVRAEEYAQDSLASVLFAANFHFASQGTNYFAQGQPPSPVQHFWSLAVEEQFYVVWPALFILIVGLSLRPHGPRPVAVRDRAMLRLLVVVGVVAVASLVWSIHDTAVHPAAAYFSTFARGWELALGAALVIGLERLRRVDPRRLAAVGWAGLVAIGVAAVAYSSATPFPGYAALLPTFGAAAVIAAGVARAVPRWGATRWLGIAPLRYVGDRSYAFYLWHWPVLVIAQQRVGHRLSVPTNLLLLLGAFALSMMSYRLIEQPCRTAQWARRPQALVAFVSAVAVVVVAATAITTSIGNREAVQAALAAPVTRIVTPHLTTRTTLTRADPGWVGGVLPAVADEVQGRIAGVPDLASLHPPVGRLLDDVAQTVPSACSAHDGESSSELCHFGRTTSPRRLVVIGDSHADMWMPALAPVGARDGWDVIPVLKSGCMPTGWTGSSGTSDCHAWWRWAMAQVRALHPDVTLLGGFYNWAGQGRGQAVLNALDGAMRALRRESRQVVLIGDAPERVHQPVDCLLAHHFTATSCTEPLALNQVNLAADVARVAADDHVTFIDPTGWFCYQGQCPLVVGNIIAYRDNTHVSQTYAQALTRVFAAALHAALGAGH